MESKCPECGAIWTDGATCQDQFYQMGFWEMSDPGGLGAAHHLIVLSYYLQHPSLYSPDGLAGAKALLVDFVERGLMPQQTRKRDRRKLASGTRTYKIKGTPDAHGVYAHPVRWTMRAADVISGGVDRYVKNVNAWAQSILDSLPASESLPAV